MVVGQPGQYVQPQQQMQVPQGQQPQQPMNFQQPPQGYQQQPQVQPSQQTQQQWPQVPQPPNVPPNPVMPGTAPEQVADVAQPPPEEDVAKLKRRPRPRKGETKESPAYKERVRKYEEHKAREAGGGNVNQTQPVQVVAPQQGPGAGGMVMSAETLDHDMPASLDEASEAELVDRLYALGWVATLTRRQQ